MNPLKDYLNKIQPEVFRKQHKGAHDPMKGDTMKCPMCGRKAHVLNNGKGPMVCCGKAMLKATLPVTESTAAVLSCRAAKSSIQLWARRYANTRDPRRRMVAKRMIAKKRAKVQKCRQRGLMI
jgi:desulfoferrodoxin-like iron-binding protein